MEIFLVITHFKTKTIKKTNKQTKKTEKNQAYARVDLNQDDSLLSESPREGYCNNLNLKGEKQNKK